MIFIGDFKIFEFIEWLNDDFEIFKVLQVAYPDKTDKETMF